MNISTDKPPDVDLDHLIAYDYYVLLSVDNILRKFEIITFIIYIAFLSETWSLWPLKQGPLHLSSRNRVLNFNFVWFSVFDEEPADQVTCRLKRPWCSAMRL